MKLPRKSVVPKSKFLVGFGDTEGVNLRNGLWSLSIIFKALVFCKDHTITKSSKLKFKKKVFNFLNYNSNCGETGSERTSRALTSHYDALYYLKREYELNGIILCFWNASHDRKEMKVYDAFRKDNPDFQIHYVDMIRFAKSISTFPSYKLENVVNTYTKEERKQTHTSLRDTTDMVQALSMILLDHKHLEEFDKLSPVGQVREIYNGLKEDYVLKEMVQFRSFLAGLILEDAANIERKVSFNLDYEDPNYTFFKTGDLDFKVRKGWNSNIKRGYKGYGLYERIGEQYKLVKSQSDKKNILDEYKRILEVEESNIPEVKEELLVNLN